jgi:putative endonuclease
VDAVSEDRRGSVGRHGERLAAAQLERQGYTVLERNYRRREGELDLVLRRAGTLVFCEVKTLVARERPGGRGPAYPLEAVHPHKRAQIRRLARAWLSDRRDSGLARGCRDVRFDAVGVVLTPGGRVVRLDHVESAF